MTRVINISIIGHIITTLAFIGVAVYAFIRQKSLHRTTRNSYGIYYAIIGICLVFTCINLFRLYYEFDDLAETNITTNLDSVAQYSGILIQSGLILTLFSKKIVTKASNHPATILAIGAHPDDIEIAAGAALAKMHDAGYCIDGLILTRGEKGGDGDTRPVEAKNGAKFLGLDRVKIMDLTDTHLSSDMVKITIAIEEMIKEVQPDIIFTHSSHDLHQDHQTVYEATMRAARNTRVTILCYESPSVTQDFHPTYFIDVGKYVDVKIQSVKEHWNQRKKPYMKADLVRGKLAFRGAQAKVDFAEGFEVARMVSAL
jgi:LmbE family N-acetylglucosaminyl deacetylase